MHLKENVTLGRFDSGLSRSTGGPGSCATARRASKFPTNPSRFCRRCSKRPGGLVTREALRDRLWGPDTFVDFEAGLNAAVRRLREALNDSADTPRYVETLPRRGYRFIAPVDGSRPACPPRYRASLPPTLRQPLAAEPVAGSTTARATRAGCSLFRACAPRRGAVGWTETPTRLHATESAARPVSDHTASRDWKLDPAMSPAGTLSPLPGTARTKTTSTSTCDRSMASLIFS